MRFVHFVCIFCFIPNVTSKLKSCNFGHCSLQQITGLLTANANLRADLKILQNNYERNISDLETNYKRNISILEAELASLKNKSRGTDAVLIVRHDLEEIDEMIEAAVYYADKNTMMGALKKIEERKNYLSQNDLTEITGIVLQQNVDVRYIRWLYYLAFYDELIANKIRALLSENKVPIPVFCKLIGDIFAKASGIIHSYSDTISTDAILEGLRLFKIQEPNIIQAVQLLREIRKVNVLWEGEMSTIDFRMFDV